MTYIDLMLACDMMAGLGGLKLKANQSFVQSQAIWLNWCGASVIRQYIYETMSMMSMSKYLRRPEGKN